MDGNADSLGVEPRNMWGTASENNDLKQFSIGLELGIPWFTVYALSTENLTRPESELETLFKLM